MKKILTISIFICFCLQSVAQVGGNSTYTFLNLTNSARVAALGGNNISINDDDLNFVYHNPALLTSNMAKNIVLNYVNYFAGINYGYVAYADNFHKIGTMASGLHYINYGKFVKANEKGEITGSFNAFELALNVFWAKPLFDSLITVGVNLKPIYSQLESYKSFGLACDLGVNYQSHSKLLSASLVVKNLGSQIKPYYNNHYEPLPFDIQLGLSQKLEHAPLRVSVLLHHLHKWDLSYNKSSNLAYSTTPNNGKEKNYNYNFNITDNILRHSIISAEFIPSKNFILMLAYNHQRRQEMAVETRPFLVGFSAGIYVKISKFRISYGQAVYHLAGSSSHFSVNVNLGDFYKKTSVD